jgi:O-antigen/teichoic acid export membrane protein
VSLAGRLTRFAGANLLHGGVTALGTVATSALLYRAVGVDFGVLTLITASMVRFNLVDDSLGSFLVTALSRRRRADGGGHPRATDDGEIGTALLLYGLFALLFAGALAAALRLLLHDRADVGLLSLLGGLGLLLATSSDLVARLLEGNEDYVGLRLCQSSLVVLRLGAVALLARAAVTSLAPYIAVYLGSSLLLAAVLGLVHRLRSPVRPLGLVRRARRRSVGPIFRFMRPLLLAKGASVLSYRLDLWIVQALVGNAASAAYAMAVAVASLAAQGLEVFKMLLPVSVRDWRHDDPAWVERFVTRTSKASVYLVGGACVAGIAAAGPLLTVWFGEAPGVAVVATWLLLGFYASTAFRSPLQVILIGQHKFDRLEGNFLVAAGLNFILSLAATAAFGGWGAALGTAAAGLFLLLANLSAGGRALGLGASLLTGRLLIGGALSCIAAVVAGNLLPAAASTWATLAVRAAGATIAFTLMFLALVLDRAERFWLWRRIGANLA